MLIQVVTNQVGQQRGATKEVIDTSRIREFLRMNPPSLQVQTQLRIQRVFFEELKKVCEVTHVFDTYQVELSAYQLKNVARTLFDQWKESRAKNAPLASWACF